MPSVNSAFINAILSDAAYAELLTDGLQGTSLYNALEQRMTPALAEYVSNNFFIVSHLESDDDLTGSGFDATVWQGLEGTEFAGQVYVSMQGTRGASDFLADADLIAQGAARSQFVDMVNWWLRITTPTTESATQIRQSTSGGYFELAPSVPGTAELVGVTHVTVNGHSLGGHLATAFARIFGGSLAIDHVATFNSAGFTVLSDLVFSDLEALLGTGAGRYLSEIQNNYFATHGINVTTNSFYNSQIGARVDLFNENSLLTQVPNHSMYKLTDALALASAMEWLDPSLTIERANAIFEVGANSFEASIEGVLNGLRRLLLDAAVGDVPNGDAGDSSPSRVVYHNTLKQLVESAAFQALAGRVRIDLSNQSLAGRARGDFSALASLITLSPVTLTAIDVAGQTVLDSTLQQVWGETFTQWQSDLGLSVEQRQAGAATFTDQWLADRAQMLQLIMLRNQQNISGNLIRQAGWTREAQFSDAGSGTSFVVAGVGGGLDVQRARISFGSNEDDALEGVNGADRLYGGNGNDVLNGGGGDDYLEGNHGNDVLNGGAGTDAMLGGAGNDTLDGGSGNDWLYGGAGHDTYVFSGSFGADVVEDSDGNGVIQVEGLGSLPLGIQVTEGVYESEDRSVSYTLVTTEAGRQDLIIRLNDRPGTITIRNWSDGGLGISMGSPEEESPDGLSIFLGDQRPPTSGPDSTYLLWSQTERAPDGSLIGGIHEEGFFDSLAGTEGSDLMYGFAGNDQLAGWIGDDEIHGGDGEDFISGGPGSDRLFGG
jgi:trimeric autotransporter adhesin